MGNSPHTLRPIGQGQAFLVSIVCGTHLIVSYLEMNYNVRVLPQCLLNVRDGVDMYAYYLIISKAEMAVKANQGVKIPLEDIILVRRGGIP